MILKYNFIKKSLMVLIIFFIFIFNCYNQRALGNINGVCVAGCGGGSSSRGASGYSGPIDTGPSPAEIAAQQKAQRQQEGHDLNEQGAQYYKNGQWQLAIDSFKAALEKWPDNVTIQSNLEAASKRLEEEQAQKERERQMGIAAQNMRDQLLESSSRIWQTAPAATTGLDFQGPNQASGSQTTQVGAGGGLDFMRPSAERTSAPFASIESRGEFYFLTKDGRKVTGKEANKIPLEEGTKVVTGIDGHIKMTLPDNTTFTVGSNTELVIDKFVYDPDKSPEKILATMTKGVFRWVTGKVKPIPANPPDMKVTLPVVAVGIRGTDFEATVQPDNSGSIVLNFGQLEITEKKTGFTFILNAGEKIIFGSDGIVSRPIKI